MTEYQRKQRERPKIEDLCGKQNAEPSNKKLKRKSSVEPLDDRGSPLPNLPEDLKQKQEWIDQAARKKKPMSPTPPPEKPVSPNGTYRNGARYVNGTGKGKKQSIEEIVTKGLKNPLEIIQLMRERKDVGFLYMAAAVPRSSIEYNPYNLK